ncbi:MAG: thioredoxin family protein [Myxococcales bacterium]|nr:thioredoxin family protein [Myxococcales bacterium]
MSLAVRSFLFTLGMLCLSGAAALAGPHFTQPVPSLEQALSTANQQNRVLLAIFSASWCGPCKVLARDLRKPGAQSALQKLHVVVYDGSEEEIGSALMRRLGVSSFPTLVAFDQAGQAAVKQSGYGTWDKLSVWLRELPEQVVPIEQAIAAAEKAPKNVELQQNVAQRLLAARRFDEARRCLVRVQEHGREAQAASAAWEILRLDVGEQQSEAGRRATEAYLGRYPTSSEASKALRYLAALPKPPRAFLEARMIERIDAAKSESDVTALITPALHAGAQKAARHAATWLASKYPDSLASLDAQAEVAFYVDHDSPRACALIEKAIATGAEKDSSGQDERRESLARYRKNQGEPSEAVREYSGPRLAPDTARGSTLPVYYSRLRQAQAAVRDGCSQTGVTQTHLLARVLTNKAAPHQVIFHPHTPAALANCAERLLVGVDLPPGRTFDIDVELKTPSDSDAIELAVATAEEECAAVAGSSRSIEVILRAAPGLPTQTFYVKAPAALQACIDRVVLALRPQRAQLQSLTLRFPAADK